MLTRCPLRLNRSWTGLSDKASSRTAALVGGIVSSLSQCSFHSRCTATLAHRLAVDQYARAVACTRSVTRKRYCGCHPHLYRWRPARLLPCPDTRTQNGLGRFYCATAIGYSALSQRYPFALPDRTVYPTWSARTWRAYRLLYWHCA